MTSHKWLPILDGGKYPESATVFQVLAASSALSFLCAPFVSHSMRERDFRFLMSAAILSVALATISGALFISSMGASGAAFCMFLGNAALTISIFLRSYRQLAYSKISAETTKLDQWAA
jgi:O-antigen/teichoic acid export membrane protein